MHWLNSLSIGIRNALLKQTPCRVVVHTETQKERGRTAMERAAPSIGGNPNIISFEITQDHPIGTVLAP